jgi:hypothetical protein
MFKTTGKMIPVPKNTFIQAVHTELENFKTKLLNGDPAPVPNPFYESLVVTINNTVVMIPPDIQNEAMASYIQTNPQLKHMMDNTKTGNMNRSYLIDSNAFIRDTDNNIEEEIDDTIPTSKNGIYLSVCILVLGLLMFLYREKLK